MAGVFWFWGKIRRLRRGVARGGFGSGDVGVALEEEAEGFVFPGAGVVDADAGGAENRWDGILIVEEEEAVGGEVLAVLAAGDAQATGKSAGTGKVFG